MQLPVTAPRPAPCTVGEWLRQSDWSGSAWRGGWVGVGRDANGRAATGRPGRPTEQSGARRSARSTGHATAHHWGGGWYRNLVSARSDSSAEGGRS